VRAVRVGAVRKLLQLAEVSLILTLIAFLVAPAATPRSVVAAGPAARSATLEARLVAAINRVRDAHGLRPLIGSGELSAVAAAHTTDMVGNGYFGHQSTNGATLEQRALRYFPDAGCKYWSVGENLVWASPGLSASRAVRAWLESPEHRAILLDPSWRDLGTAVVDTRTAPGVYAGRRVTVVTADFGVCRH
jgi:uncharacterized protein YkwD